MKAMKKNLLFFVISITLLSYSRGGREFTLPSIYTGGGGGYSDKLCFPIIQYHESNICDDSAKEAGVAVTYLDKIEGQLSEIDIGECVLVTFIGVNAERKYAGYPPARSGMMSTNAINNKSTSERNK